ncbi:hypothetical protein FOZ62_014803 [Perkinsus olseni]|uniref:Ubiquitin-like domain-containing protein n=1 Tax=Perkinsus olseni TaxID=32597 RepID=A0A7J6PV27_PEROL|nr:hypothetical protein FOZ62_014803 [Perkinsus olseni]
MTTTTAYNDRHTADTTMIDHHHHDGGGDGEAVDGSGKMVTLRLIFVNHDGKALEEKFNVTQPTHSGHGLLLITQLTDTVMDVKKRIMHEEKWPKDFLPVSEVGRLRIFSGGKELEDNKTLADSKIMVNPTVPTPIHVSAVPKSVKAGKW